MNAAVLAVVLLAVLGHQTDGHHRLTDMRDASAEFIQKLYLKLSRNKKEFCLVSPISLHSSLAMTSLGARNETAEEMEKVLNLSSFPPSEAHEEYHEILTELQSIQDVKLEIINAILVRSDKVIEQEFKDAVENKYLAKIESFDLNEPEPEKTINEYVSQKTKGETTEIVKKGSIDASTSLVVVSTICFKASFQDRFDESKTRKKEFTCENGKTGEVQMMNDTRQALFKRDNVTDSVVLSIPFKTGRHSFIAVLPRRAGDLLKLQERISEPGKLFELLEGLKPVSVHIVLPKFKIHSRYQLKEKLEEMGMESAFNRSYADLSGISKSGKLFISEVHHAAFIDIDEKGASASAATVIEVENSSQEIKEEEEVAEEEFRADHSFFFFIQDNTNKQLIFQGRFTGPTK